MASPFSLFFPRHRKKKKKKKKKNPPPPHRRWSIQASTPRHQPIQHSLHTGAEQRFPRGTPLEGGQQLPTGRVSLSAGLQVSLWRAHVQPGLHRKGDAWQEAGGGAGNRREESPAEVVQCRGGLNWRRQRLAHRRRGEREREREREREVGWRVYWSYESEKLRGGRNAGLTIGVVEWSGVDSCRARWRLSQRRCAGGPTRCSGPRSWSRGRMLGRMRRRRRSSRMGSWRRSRKEW